MPLSEPSVVSVSALDRLDAGDDAVYAFPAPPPFPVPGRLCGSCGSEWRLLGAERVSCRRSSRASCSLHAIALSRRIRLASLTRRRKSGSVVRVRKVSLRILEYAGDAPRCISDR
jgi:hypothetical protein